MVDKISDLTIRNYDGTKYSRRMTRVVGEKAGVRIIDIKDREDMLRYKEINDRLNEDEFENVFLSGEVIDKQKGYYNHIDNKSNEYKIISRCCFPVFKHGRQYSIKR